MLSPMPTVPHVLAADVHGIDGRLLLVLTDTASLWVIGKDMAQVQMDLAAVEALQQLLGEVAAAMRAAAGWPDPPGSNGQPSA